jgi:hypothetical protein
MSGEFIPSEGQKVSIEIPETNYRCQTDNENQTLASNLCRLDAPEQWYLPPPNFFYLLQFVSVGNRAVARTIYPLL